MRNTEYGDVECHRMNGKGNTRRFTLMEFSLRLPYANAPTAECQFHQKRHKNICRSCTSSFLFLHCIPLTWPLAATKQHKWEGQNPVFGRNAEATMPIWTSSNESEITSAFALFAASHLNRSKQSQQRWPPDSVEDQRGKEVIEQKAPKDAKRRNLCDLRDLLLSILEQGGVGSSLLTLSTRLTHSRVAPGESLCYLGCLLFNQNVTTSFGL